MLIINWCIFEIMREKYCKNRLIGFYKYENLVILWFFLYIEVYGEKLKREIKCMILIYKGGYIFIIYYNDNMIKFNARREMFLKKINFIGKITYIYFE